MCSEGKSSFSGGLQTKKKQKNDNNNKQSENGHQLDYTIVENKYWYTVVQVYFE